mmetsp:Transcript_37826/g.106865  ORF Transcript_37826/g.106865 Transcript_37826/m.106865 type:complete len:156 (+) Transcript_37826:152-619(+)
MAHAKGNAFAQAVHDAGTLKNKQKFLAYGLQFVDPALRQNFVVCVALKPCFDGTDRGVAEELEMITAARCGLPLDNIVGSVISDRAAKGVSEEFGLEEEVCGMHDGDKLGRSAIGELLRRRDKKVINPFPEGAELMAKAHEMAVHFQLLHPTCSF